MSDMPDDHRKKPEEIVGESQKIFHTLKITGRWLAILVAIILAFSIAKEKVGGRKLETVLKGDNGSSKQETSISPKANVTEVKTIIAPVGEWSEEGVVVKKGLWSCFPPENTKVVKSDGGEPFDDGPGFKNNTGEIKVGTILWYKSAGNKPVVVPCFNVDTITARPPV